MKINLKKPKAFKAKFSVKNVLQQPGYGAFACISTQMIIPIQTQFLKGPICKVSLIHFRDFEVAGS